VVQEITQSTSQRPRILVIDDEPIVLRFLSRALRRKGYEVDVAENAEQAKKMLDSVEYDLILTDVNLPGESGKDLLAHCKQSHPDTEIILITGYPSLDDAVQTVRDGAYDYLAKPIELDKLYARVEAALKRHETRTSEVLKTWSMQAGAPTGLRVIRSLGSGSMGVVLLVEKDGELLAMKILRQRPGGVPSDRLLDRFAREAEVLRRVRHPGVVRVYEFDLDPEEKLPYILMEYVPGKSLSWHIAEGRLTLPQKFCIIRDVADVLAAIHEHGILHRDIKPSNILITENLRPKVTDFGIARLADSQLTMTGELLGTPAYMAPERLDRRRIDHRSDLFSLGVTAYELLTGSRPFYGETFTELVASILRDDPLDPCRLAPDLPRDVVPILNRMLEKDVSRRYQRAEDIVRDLDALIKNFDA